MSRHEPKPGPQSTRPSEPEDRFGLSLSQLVASALAAASAAFGASFLGVAGTFIGAAVASVIATLASAMYTSSLQRSSDAVRRTATQWTRTAEIRPVVDPNAPTTSPAADRTVFPDPDAPDDTRELDIAPEPFVRRPLPWARISVAAVAVLAITLGVLTGVEGILGKPIASVVGGSDATGTSLGSVGGSGSSDTGVKSTPTDTPTPTPTRTPTPTTDTTDTATPTADPTGSSTPSPTTTPTTSTPSPTADPSATATGD
jgi:hypothetical protein